MPWTLILLTIAGGAFGAVQARCASRLNEELSSPMTSAVLMQIVGLLTLLLVSPLFGPGLPSRAQLAQVPWWAWGGGAVGCFYILSAVLASGRLGSAVFNGVLISSTLLASLLLDHFGLLGYEARPATLSRVLGGALMVLGIGLVSRI